MSHLIYKWPFEKYFIPMRCRSRNFQLKHHFVTDLRKVFSFFFSQNSPNLCLINPFCEHVTHLSVYRRQKKTMKKMKKTKQVSQYINLWFQIWSDFIIFFINLFRLLNTIIMAIMICFISIFYFSFGQTVQINEKIIRK